MLPPLVSAFLAGIKRSTGLTYVLSVLYPQNTTLLLPHYSYPTPYLLRYRSPLQSQTKPCQDHYTIYIMQRTTS